MAKRKPPLHLAGVGVPPGCPRSSGRLVRLVLRGWFERLINQNAARKKTKLAIQKSTSQFIWALSWNQFMTLETSKGCARC